MRKKLLCIAVAAVMVAASSGSAFANSNMNFGMNSFGGGYGFGNGNGNGNDNSNEDDNGYGKEYKQSHNYKVKYEKKEYKFNDKKSIKVGNYTIPYEAIVEGMGATVAYDKKTTVLTVVKNEITIIIDFKNKTVTVNGVADTGSGIFKASNGKKNSVLTQYIAKKLGANASCDNDGVTVERPKLAKPKNVKVTLIGTEEKPITGTILNTKVLYVTATADITAGEAAGGKAELYVGDKLVAADTVITPADTQVSFTTSDGSPMNTELQTAIPKGGAVTVKLYNVNNDTVETKTNINLSADYIAPTLTGITSAVYLADEGILYLVANGAGNIMDSVDVTKLTFVDTALNKTYQLTSAPRSGSAGTVKSATSLKVTLGSTDKGSIKEFSTAVTLKIAAGGLITDKAGNTSPAAATEVSVPVIVIK